MCAIVKHDEFRTAAFFSRERKLVFAAISPIGSPSEPAGYFSKA